MGHVLSDQSVCVAEQDTLLQKLVGYTGLILSVGYSPFQDPIMRSRSTHFNEECIQLSGEPTTSLKYIYIYIWRIYRTWARTHT